MKEMKEMLQKGFLVMVVLLFFACKGKDKTEKDNRDTPNKGTIRISADESFKPVIEEQIKMHHSTFPDTKILVSYKPEVECLKDLQNDSTRMILIARGLTKNESSIFESGLGYKPQFGILAYDAVAVIVNHASPDSVFTVKELQNILSGKSKRIAVMDGKNATSTVRFLQDSVLRGNKFGENVVASKNSDDVIDIVSKNENVVGFVGLSWVGDSYDSKQVANLQKIRLALVECVRCEEKGLFAKPSQATISYAQYPLPRPLYYILKENSAGLGTGFMNFMSLERGQLIFKRALLVPAKMNFKVRSGKIKDAD
ncbi:MAG: substrate-binding domain-containing protein [Chitinophagaceae bacterium]|nr:substrate-binding domain-containing protein [Chitinophagaceae bacterium]